MSERELHALSLGLASELRNALFGIAATLDSFEHRFGSEPDHARYLVVLRDWVARMIDFAEQLRAYGLASAPPRVAPASLSEIARAAVRATLPIATPLGVSIDLSQDPGAPPVLVDRAKLLFAIQDVIRSAIGASPEAGVVSVRTSRRDGEVSCEIVDQGPALEDEEHASALDPFIAPTRRSRRGIGLAIARRIVVAHGGAIEATNAAGEGVVVRIRLPVA